jgi:hypothetical protein
VQSFDWPPVCYCASCQSNKIVTQCPIGDGCPTRCGGRLYRLAHPSPKIWITGGSFLQATRYDRERLRCSSCLELFTAPLPVGNGKFAPSADAAIAADAASANWVGDVNSIEAGSELWGMSSPGARRDRTPDPQAAPSARDQTSFLLAGADDKPGPEMLWRSGARRSGCALISYSP